jgi:hypothetical protein
MSDVRVFCMLQLANVERRKWATLLIILYLAAHLAVSFLKLVQTLCILALVMLCVWDQVLVGFEARWNHEKSKMPVSQGIHMMEQRAPSVLASATSTLPCITVAHHTLE